MVFSDKTTTLISCALVLAAVGSPRQSQTAFAAEGPVAQSPRTKPADTGQPGLSSSSSFDSFKNLQLVEPFTAHTLRQGEIQLGTMLDFGVFDRVMIGTDLIATAIGAPTVHIKANVYESENNSFAIGVREGYLSRSTLFWGSSRNDYEELSAKIIRPSVSWSHRVSGRLQLHSHYATAFGKISAKLSDQGKRRLYESKHPDGDFDRRRPDAAPDPIGTDAPPADTTSTPTQNPERRGSEGSPLAQRSLQIQSLLGLQSDVFQVTGEFFRKDGNKILISSRMEQVELEDLRGNITRLTIAQHWIWPSFQIRFGIGAQYLVLSGKDLDGEALDESGVLPASEFEFYWKL